MRIFNGYTLGHLLNAIVHGRLPNETVIGAKLKLLDKLKHADPDNDEASYRELLNNIAQLSKDEYHEYRNNPKWFHMRFPKSDKDDTLSSNSKKLIQKHLISQSKKNLDQLENLID